MSITSKKFSKERIQDGELNISLVEKDHQPSLALTLKVKNYSKLKKRVFYYRSAKTSHYRWLIELTKVKGTLFIVLSTKKMSSKRVYFSIDNIDHTKVREHTAEKISQYVYVAEYCSKTISDRRNKFLTDDTLTVKCSCDLYPIETAALLFPTPEHYGQADKDYFRNIYETSFCADFTLKLIDCTIRVHKYVLCLFSKVFAELIVGDGKTYFNMQEAPLDTSFDIMDRMLIYMYGGDLKIDDKCRTEMLRVAHRLEMVALINVLEAK